MRSKRLARVIQDPNHPITSCQETSSQTNWKQGKSCSKNKHRSLTTCPFGYGVESAIMRQKRECMQALQTYLHEIGLSNADLMAMWDYPVDN